MTYATAKKGKKSNLIYVSTTFGAHIHTTTYIIKNVRNKVIKMESKNKQIDKFFWRGGAAEINQKGRERKFICFNLMQIQS